jgi:hypothetical protein
MNKQQIEKVKKDLAFGASDRCFRKPYCGECDYYGANGVCNFNNKNVMRDALSVIEQMALEIDDLRAALPSGEEEPEARTPENLLDMSENARIERVIDKLRLMRRQFQPGSEKSGALLDAMFFLRLMQERSIQKGGEQDV